MILTEDGTQAQNGQDTMLGGGEVTRSGGWEWWWRLWRFNQAVLQLCGESVSSFLFDCRFVPRGTRASGGCVMSVTCVRCVARESSRVRCVALPSRALPGVVIQLFISSHRKSTTSCPYAHPFLSFSLLIEPIILSDVADVDCVLIIVSYSTACRPGMVDGCAAAHTHAIETLW